MYRIAASNASKGVKSCAWLAAILWSAVLSELAQAAPFTPVSDELVIQLLPQRLSVVRRPGDAVRPGDAAAATTAVQTLIEAARRQGDPRYLGQAAAELRRWEPEATMPVPLLVLRATVQQSLHQFDAALATLALALQRTPMNPQALLTRATILQVRGDYPAAERDCQQLWRLGATVPAQLCLAGVASVNGRAPAADLLLQRVIGGLPDDDHSTRVWAYTLLAESAERQGEQSAAMRYFELAHAVDAGDRYLIAAFCDFLLDQRLPQRVLELTESAVNDDNLQLRRALALRQLGDPRATSLALLLRERHDLAARRGERTHLREAARLALWLEGSAQHALQLAQQNWQQQKEPADLRILLEAATAAHDRTTRVAALNWMRTSGIQDRRLSRLGAA
jgi:tetratricopeptide (TPR) repeat protein